MADYLKAEQLGSTKWRVLAIPFGGPFGGKDTDDEYFSPRTDIKAEWFAKRPVIWHHGLDRTVKDDELELGVEDDLEKKDDGWWATMWLDRSARYWAEVNKLLGQSKIFGSSGAIAHLVKKAGDGEILRWPHAEQTLTPTPANFYSRIVASKAVDRLSPVGVRELLSDLDSLTADLRSDLPTGGDEAAMTRLAKALDSLEELLPR